jgi:hypothetical protein
MPDRTNSTFKAIYIDIFPGRYHVHTDKSLVRGRVRVDPSKRPQRVNIAFKGREKCSITRSSGDSTIRYREKLPYFAYELELFSSSTGDRSYEIVSHGIAQDNKVDFAFEFRFPEFVTIQERADKWPASPQFVSNGCESPPSYEHYARSHNDEQHVEYYLEAKLYTENRYTPTMEVRQSIIYRPKGQRPSHPIPAIQTPRNARLPPILIRTHKLHPEYDPNEGFKSKLKHRFTKHKETTPYAKFQLAANCPSVCVLGKPVDLKFSLAHLDRTPDIPVSPPVFLRRILVRLRSTIHVRVPIESFFSGSIKMLDDDHEDKTVLLDRGYNEGDGLLLYDGMLVATNKWPATLTPPFKSYGLNLEHTMEVNIWGECAREKFKMTLVHGKVMGVLVEGADSVRDSAVTRADPADEDGLVLPPPLGEDVSPPPYQVLGKS